jgi:ABC-type proline/glycine betaine transport system permease subunit
VTRILFVAAVVCIATGGSLTGNYTSSSSVSTGRTIEHVAHILIAVLLAIIVSVQGLVWLNKERLTGTGLKVLKLSLPPFGLFILWECSSLVWYGSATIFALMGLSMEYVVLVVYLYVGMTIPREREGKLVGERVSLDTPLTNQ